MRIVYLVMACVLLGSANLWAQIGISGPPDPSAVLDLKSPHNDKAFYPPRLSSAQRLAIINPQAGALVYDLDKGTLFLYDGQNWLPLLTTDVSLLAPISRTASDGAAGDNFGYSIAISGDYALVGALTKAIGSNARQGAAYVFVRSGNSWRQQQRLTASDGEDNDNFGSSVALSGDYALVGASHKLGNKGAAYVFVRSGTSWSQQQRLTASDGAVEDYFGSSVAISGDYILVGAYQKNSVYVFVQGGSNWSQQQRLMASDAASGDGFGASVAVSGNYALVGAPYKAIGSNANQGAAYVFIRSTSSWNQQQRVTASDGAANDLFGSSVSISGNYALVGAPEKMIGGNANQGAAYVFMRSASGWTQQQRVTDNSPANTYTGFSVGLMNGTYLIGGYGNQGKVSFGTVN